LPSVCLLLDLADDSAGQRGCGIAFRDQINRGSHPTSKARQALLQLETAAAQARWSTRHLPDQSPPHSPIRPAPPIPPGTPSKSILKKRASTGDIRSRAPDIGPASQMQGYIDGLRAFETAYDAQRTLRGERYTAEGLYEETPRIRTLTDSTIRPGASRDTGERAVDSVSVRTESTQLEQARPAPTRSEEARPVPFTRLPPIQPPYQPAPTQIAFRPYASTSQLDDAAITRASRHRGEARVAQTLSPLEPTPALSDISLPSTQEVQSPDDFITMLPKRRRPKSANARRPVPPDPATGPSDGPETARSYQDDSPNDGLNHFVNGIVASLEEYADIGDTESENASNPPSPVDPPCDDPATPPRASRPGTILDVSAPSTVLPIHFSHLPITVDREIGLFGPAWPFDQRYPVNLYQAMSRETTAYLSAHAYAKTVKSLDNLRARCAQMEMIKAGGPLGMDSAGVDQVFVFPKPEGSSQGDVPVEEVLGVLDSNAERATLALQDMDAEERRIAKGKSKEVSAEHLAWMKRVVDGMRDENVSEKENFLHKGKDEDDKPKGNETAAVNRARMVNLLKRLNGQAVALKEYSRSTDGESIPAEWVGGSLQIKKELDTGKGRNLAAKSEKSVDEVRLQDALSGIVTPPKKPLVEGPSSIRTTQSTQSLRITRSTTKATNTFQFTEPTVQHLSPDKMPTPTAGWTANSNLHPQLRSGSTPSIPQAAARVLDFERPNTFIHLLPTCLKFKNQTRELRHMRGLSGLN